MEILKVDSLFKKFGGLQVLQNVSFSVQAGEKLAIIGPNGAGKTTLFNVLGGQLPATAGHTFLRGQEITGLAPYHRLHRGLARSFQINNLFANLTLLDNMLLALKGARYPHFQIFRPMKANTDIFTLADNLIESMGLSDRKSTPVNALPHGEQRLLEVALALASNPKVLLLDEPTAGLTTAEAAAFGDTIIGLLGETTLIFCAHDMDLVFNLADRIMVLYFGQIIARGTPQEIRANPKVKEIYLGSEKAK